MKTYFFQILKEHVLKGSFIQRKIDKILDTRDFLKNSYHRHPKSYVS